ncbi:transglycosylase SLT domain-containing protein [Frigidibacter sp.]|uniref:transglycosylase SLT domain-containing protein n=1 Tax=Frigidibacter sp. TaxID=2586418 RepID=UPI0035243A25
MQIDFLLRSIRFIVAVCALAVVARPVTAVPADLSLVCERAAEQAAQQMGVPISVLKAISLTETGRNRGGEIRPWPWTVNMEGAGHWFETEDEARSFVYGHFKRGARSFDVGCFQINYKWHGENFSSIDQMFDPLANALYAAKFLRTLHAEKGDWTGAAGAYHSRTPQFAEKYAARFDRFRAGLRHQDLGDLPEIPDIVLAAARPVRPLVPRENRFPLLQAGSGAGLGSLVPIGNGAGASLFASAQPLPLTDTAPEAAPDPDSPPGEGR